MKNIILSEIRQLLKNKIFVIYCVLLFLYEALCVYKAFTGNFIADCNWLIEMKNQFGVTLSDVVNGGLSQDITEYAHIASYQSCFVFPVYVFGNFVMLFFIPVICFFFGSEINSKVAKLKVACFGKYKYVACKSIALGIWTGVLFLAMGLVTLLEVFLLRIKYFEDHEIREIYNLVSESISNCIVQFMCVVLFIVIFVTVISILAMSLGYLSTIAYVGMIVPFFSLISGNICGIYFIRDVMAFMYSRLLPMSHMCSHSVTTEDYTDIANLNISYVFWIVIILGISFLLLRGKKQYTLL